jgi:hypothetical protein
LGLDFDIPVGIFATNEMLRNYADLGISAWYGKIHDLFAALKVSRYSGIGERWTKGRHRQEQKLRQTNGFPHKLSRQESQEILTLCMTNYALGFWLIFASGDARWQYYSATDGSRWYWAGFRASGGRTVEIRASVGADAHLYASGKNSGVHNCRANMFASVGRFSPWGFGAYGLYVENGGSAEICLPSITP